ncbi:TlyA family RNA methyltransferase [Enterovirga rhinocerotis]|uniref:23S rRNA (Cytidine1920-2'-O)/16S rRNA (Cytidine1409-2'-O)-methyltransferase n=1 Tax=Enterovirga rhinocerotis TaxID=1339210 RepID=A0A4R7C6U9_9HYPH|nr:TlyA family RNA methyltransferase [Enterovirga rhinocerotis]TDR94314.1 23S rRNA (cytidine1920-2'-O)/16S rRNA (cytidine1409-2'-O)-methyltransferase [Enterovirga rhinocerotis]
MGGERRRADMVLVSRGLFESRARARAAIEAGLVSADGAAVRKPSDMIRDAAAIEAAAPHPYVSRGGVKLAAALDAFGIDPAGCDCLDVGASTGGFTDVLLRRGARHVIALDVGREQLHATIAADPRVTALEATDIRRAEGLVAPGSIDLATVDVSFISLDLVLPMLVSYLKDMSQLVVLIKPQFEVGRTGLGRGGIVRDDALRDEAVARIVGRIGDLGFRVVGPIPSPIEGGDGNREFLAGAIRG